MMRRMLYASGLGIFLATESVRAAGMGLTGNVEYVYDKQRYSTPTSESEKETLLQKYGLGYSSYLYSPKLLMYELMTSFQYDDTSTVFNDVKSKYNADAVNYRGDFHFLRESKIPVNVYFFNTESPFTYVQGAESGFFNNKNRGYGLSGSVHNDFADLLYHYGNSTTEMEGSVMSEKRDHTEYMAGAVKKTEAMAFNATYTHSETDYEKEYSTTGPLNYTDTYDLLNANLAMQAGETVNLRMDGSYYASNLFNLESKTASLTTAWRPTEKYNASMVLFSNATQSDVVNTNVVSASGTSNYALTPDTFTFQNINLMRTTTNDLTTDVGSMQLGINQQKELPDQLSVGWNVNVSSQIEGNTGHNDQNVTFDGRNSYYYNLGGSVSKTFGLFQTRLYLRGNSLFFDSSLGESGVRLRFNGGLDASFTRSLSYSLLLGHEREKRNDYDWSSRDIIGREKVSYNANSKVQYRTNLGYNGTFTSSLGFTYINTSQNYSNRVTGRRSIDKLYPYGNVNIRYQVWGQWVFTARGQVSYDTYTETSQHRGTADLSYNARKFYASVGATYRKLESVVIQDATHSRIYAKIGRKF